MTNAMPMKTDEGKKKKKPKRLPMSASQKVSHVTTRDLSPILTTTIMNITMTSTTEEIVVVRAV